MAASKLKRRHLSGLNEYFDRGYTDIKTIAAVHSQSRCWVKSDGSPMSALLPLYPPKADIHLEALHVRKVPPSTEVANLIRSLVGAAEQRRRDIDAERFSAASEPVVPFFIHIAGPHGQRRVPTGRACAR
jgi:hypothetical protein